MKYIVMGGLDLVMFPCHIEHAKHATLLGGTDKVTSAGFVGTDDQGKLYCYGESFSLHVSSNQQQDTRLLHLLLKQGSHCMRN